MSPRVGLNLEMIIKTAAEMADKEGIETVTLASLARKLNVRSPSLFNHISGLPNLKRELSLYGLKLLYEDLAVATEEKEKDEAIIAMANAYLLFSREHPGIYELTLRAHDPNDQEMDQASSRILHLISSILADYHLNDEETIHAIRGFRSILHGYSSLEQKGAFGMPVKLEDSFHLLLEGYISFLRKK